MKARYTFPETHGLYNKYRCEYRCWQDMKQRCTNAKHTSFKDYGARGITVCDSWLQSFPKFLSDLGPRPPSYSLDRVDNNQGYSPENCRWATQTTQSRNTRASTSIDAGVFIEKSTGKWQCFIAVNHQSIRIGSYPTKEEAIEARSAAEIKYWVNGDAPPAKGGCFKRKTRIKMVFVLRWIWTQGRNRTV
jgi:hypothetical protein